MIKARCKCIKKRGAGECDCDICTVVHENLPLYHRAQTEWWRDVELRRCPVAGTFYETSAAELHQSCATSARTRRRPDFR